MTGTDPDPWDDPRRWAAGQLGVAPDAGPAEVRAAFLRLLERSDFAPPARCRRAWRLLNDAAGSAEPDPDALLDEEERLWDEVQEFAARFWGLDPGERRRQWTELSARCAGTPGLRALLQQLEAALSVRRAAAADEGLAGELAARVQDISVSRPADRAAARQALRRRARESPREWAAAARALRQRRPDLAALQPELVASLADWEQRQRHLETMRQRLKNAPKVAAKPAAKSGGSGIPRLVWIMLFLVLGGICKLTIPGSSDHTATAPPAPWPVPGARNGADQPRDVPPPELRDKLLKPGGPKGEALKRLLQDETDRQKRDPGVEEHPGKTPPPGPGPASSAKAPP